jgi:hypothetical protein
MYPVEVKAALLENQENQSIEARLPICKMCDEFDVDMEWDGET